MVTYENSKSCPFNYTERLNIKYQPLEESHISNGPHKALIVSTLCSWKMKLEHISLVYFIQIGNSRFLTGVLTV